MIREVSHPKWTDISPLFKRNPIPRHLTVGSVAVRPVGSGKGALALVLGFLRETGTLENKLAEVLVPDWIGNWVYGQIQQFAFPSKRLTSRTRAILLYHQYGFPQDFDAISAFAREHNLVIIEDCAHSLGSFYKGKPVGTLAQFSIFSFSKFFFCFALGGIYSTHPEFDDYVAKRLEKSPAWALLFKDTVKLVHERALRGGPPSLSTNMLLEMSYGIYGSALRPSAIACQLAAQKIDHEIAIRFERYCYFREQTKGLPGVEHLVDEQIVPYVIPVRSSQLGDALMHHNISLGHYQFDMARNMLKPDFQPVQWIPCHSGIADSTFRDLTAVVAASLEQSKPLNPSASPFTLSREA